MPLVAVVTHCLIIAGFEPLSQKLHKASKMEGVIVLRLFLFASPIVTSLRNRSAHKIWRSSSSVFTVAAQLESLLIAPHPESGIFLLIFLLELPNFSLKPSSMPSNSQSSSPAEFQRGDSLILVMWHLPSSNWITSLAKTLVLILPVKLITVNKPESWWHPPVDIPAHTAVGSAGKNAFSPLASRVSEPLGEPWPL